MTRSGASALSTPTEFDGKKSVLIRSSSLVGVFTTSSVLNPMPVRPDCHAIVCRFPGSYDGFFAQLAALASKFGRNAGSSSVAQPFWMSADRNSPFVMTMMSRPVSCPACSCGRSSPKNEALSLISSEYVTAMSVAFLNSLRDGLPVLSLSMYRGQFEKLSLLLAVEGSKSTAGAVLEPPPPALPPPPEHAARIDDMLRVPTVIPPSFIMFRRDIRREVRPRASAGERPG